MARASRAKREVTEEPGVSLADVITMARENPIKKPKRPQPWTADRVDALPKATHQMLAPIAAVPGSAYQVVAEGGPMPPGAEELHRLTVEMLEAHARRYQYELRDQRIADEERRLEELEKMGVEIERQHAAAKERLAELEAMEPVEAIDWPSVAAQVWRISGYEDIPASLRDGISKLPERVIDRPGNSWVLSGGPPNRMDRYGRFYE